MARGCTSPTPSTARGTSRSTRPWSSKKHLGGKERGLFWMGSLLERGKAPHLGGYKDAFVIAEGQLFLTSSPQLPHVEFHMQLTHKRLWLGEVQLLPVRSCSARVLLGRAQVFQSERWSESICGSPRARPCLCHSISQCIHQRCFDVAKQTMTSNTKASSSLPVASCLAVYSRPSRIQGKNVSAGVCHY